MASASEHGRTVLAAIIPDRRDLLDRALRHLVPGHFPDPTLAVLFQMLERYAEVTGAIITRPALGDLLRAASADAGKVALFEETYDLLASVPADEASFRWSLQQLRELAAERATSEALTQAMHVLTRGLEDHRGDLMRGHHAARQHLLSRFAEIDRDLAMQESPEGDMRTEGQDMLGEYARREAIRRSGLNAGIRFGIPTLDAKVDGINPGELALLAGYSNEGKTSAMVQLSWSAAVEQGRNVVILTTETVRDQVRRRILARHSCLPHFGLPRGLNSRDIKLGTLSEEHKAALAAVVTDFTANPAYGRVWITQVPRGATIGYIESKLTRYQRMFPIDLVVMDYLALLKAEKRRNTDREELGSILKDAKQLATGHNDGNGVAFVSPWQVSRTARFEAERTGSYTPAALSETAEATNSPDLIVSLLAPLDNHARTAKLKMQVMKNRDGETAGSIEVMVDYATSCFALRSAQSDSIEDISAGLGLLNPLR